MADRLRPDTCEEIRTLCRKISVAHDLDAEIQEELYGHMEDKLIAYLDGEETLAEEDAFILVREHFGNPSALKGLLQDVHAYEANVSLARRLAAALIVTGGVSVVCGYLLRVAFQWIVAGGLSGTLASLGVFTGLTTVTVLTVVLPWLLLLHWQRRLDAGHTPWFLTWRPAYLVGAIAALLVLGMLVQMTPLFDNSVLSVTAVSLWWLMAVIMHASPVLKCMVWLWWCDRSPRKARALGTVAGLWAIWVWSSNTAIGIAHTIRSAPVSDARLLPRIAQDLATSLAYIVLCAVIACALYTMARYAAAGLTRWSEARR